MQVSRRQFFKICAGGMAGTTAAALGFAPSVALAETRQYKLLRTRETRNTCTYCSVGCGLLMYSLGDGAKNAKASIFHIEGDPDHPVNRGALCPKGAGLVDFIHSESRLKFPEYRAPGSDKWQQISWEEAFDRIAKLMKEDRDANYIAQNAEGVTVNRWLSTGIVGEIWNEVYGSGASSRSPSRRSVTRTAAPLGGSGMPFRSPQSRASCGSTANTRSTRSSTGVSFSAKPPVRRSSVNIW